MRLLGSYKSNLAPFHYEELLKLLEQAVELGEFSGNKTFDSTEIEKLQQQAQDFGGLGAAEAGQRVTDDSINNPVSILLARFMALYSETTDFQKRAALLIAVLEKDTVLLEQLLAGADLQGWARSKPPLQEATSFQWDYAMGFGLVSADIDATDPATGVLYDDRPPLATFLDDGGVVSGLVPPATVRKVPVKSLIWTYTANGQEEALYGDDWARLSLLEPRPRINFTVNPRVDIILPRNTAQTPFEITGVPASGSLPVYVRVTLYPRRNSTTLTPANAVTSNPVVNGSASNSMVVKPRDQVYLEATQSATPGANGTFKLRLAFYYADGNPVLDVVGNTLRVSLPSVTPALNPELYEGIIQVPDVAGIALAKLESVVSNNNTGTWTVTGYRAHLPQFLGVKDINPDEVDVFTTDTVYFLNEDYLADDSGQVTFRNVPDGTALTARYTELYPAYQCSVNEIDWSPVVMLDPARPYPDAETKFLPVELTEDDNGLRTRFPITDELGVPMGMSIKMLNRPTGDYYLRVSTETDGAQPGAEAMLEVEFDRPTYLTGLSLSPFSTFPCRLVTFETQGLTADTRSLVYDGQQLLDRPVTLRFTRRLVRRVFLRLFQENYSIKDVYEEPPDKLRRDALNAIQSSLPFNVRRTQRPVVKHHHGFQYDFGLEEMTGVDWQFQTPGVFVAGPFRFSGAPEVLRFDADVAGSTQFYLCFRAYDSSGVEQDVQLQGVALVPGTCVVFPFASSLERSKVTKTDVFVKAVFRSSSDMVERLQLQATQL